MMCGFALSEALDMLLLPTVDHKTFEAIEHQTRSASIWFNFGLIRPLAVVYTMDGGVTIAHGVRNAARVIVCPQLRKGNVPDNNPSMGVALLGVIYFSLMIFGHYGVALSLVFTAGFSILEALVTIGALAWFLGWFVRPLYKAYGLLPFMQFDRFSIVHIKATVGLLAALTTWIAIIDDSVLRILTPAVSPLCYNSRNN